VIEITEHTHIESYEVLQPKLDRLRRAGVRFAVDDAGAGFSSFRHIIQLNPDIIKLDADLTRNCHCDAVRHTLTESLVRFAGELGATLVAEGVETVEELEALIGMGVQYAQGYYLGRPAPVLVSPDRGRQR
jgi:EAL domain-containing protein (putative c-di-GMP-specific phosphodiesterase class I)